MRRRRRRRNFRRRRRRRFRNLRTRNPSRRDFVGSKIARRRGIRTGAPSSTRCKRRTPRTPPGFADSARAVEAKNADSTLSRETQQAHRRHARAVSARLRDARRRPRGGGDSKARRAVSGSEREASDCNSNISRRVSSHSQVCISRETQKSVLPLLVAIRSSRARRAARPLDMSGETILRGDLPGVKLTSSTGWTSEVYRHGAHVASWKTPDGEDLIFVSSDVGALPSARLPSRPSAVPATDPALTSRPRTTPRVGRLQASQGDSRRDSICFPQFSDFGPLGQHGFARNRSWEVRGPLSVVRPTRSPRRFSSSYD